MSKNTDFLFNALKKGDVSAARTIVEKLNVDINCVEEDTGITPLLRSIFQQNSELVKLCIYLGADVNKVAKVENTMISPIMRAVYQRDFEIVEILKSSNNVVITEKVLIDNSEFTPIERALYQQDYHIVAVLNGVTPDCSD